MSDEKYKNTIPTFTLKPKTSTSAICNVESYVDSGDNVTDIPIQIDNITGQIDDNSFTVTTMNTYNIIGKYYHANVAGGYMHQNSKIPLYYLAVFYDSNSL